MRSSSLCPINKIYILYIYILDVTGPLNKQFYNPIPSIYISSKGLPIQLYFKIAGLNSSEFTQIICDHVPVDFVYTVFIKVRYNVDKFFMVGNQFGFNYICKSDIEDLLTVTCMKLEEYMIDYNLTEDAIVYIQLSFRQKDKKLLSEFALLPGSVSNHVPGSDLALVERNLAIPVSIHKDSLGKPLPVEISDGVITDIHIEIDGKLVNFLDVIKAKANILRAKHKDNITSFDAQYKFYLLKDKYDYVLAVKISGPEIVDKIRYSISGVVLGHVTDIGTCLRSIAQGDIIIRNSGETQLIIRGNKVISITQNIKLKPLDKPINKPLFVENNNIGAIDIETYESKDGIIKVYAIGYKTNLNPKAVTYYLDQNSLDSSKIILALVNELLRSKYSNVTFYCHNLGGYDIVFILSTLYAFNDNNPEDQYNISCLLCYTP